WASTDLWASVRSTISISGPRAARTARCSSPGLRSVNRDGGKCGVMTAAFQTRARTAIALDALEHPLVCKALSVWQAARGPHKLPAKAQLTPRTMADFLKNTALLRVLDG